MNLSLINTIEAPDSLPEYFHWLEKAGDVFITPGRMFFGRWYVVEALSKDHLVLKSPETFDSLPKIAAVALLPLSIVSTIVGLGAKTLAHRLNPYLADKYSFPTLINARTLENFAGRLPPNPLTPNCVNTQQKSNWGELYNADPIHIPPTMANPIVSLKELLATAKVPNFDAEKASLVEEAGNYLHYTYTVEIPTGPLQGTYIDDVDIYFDSIRRCFEIRSASRVGFRDAVHLDFHQQGANKKRIEAIRRAWASIIP